MHLKALALCFLLQGCTYYVGLAVHAEGADAPEFYAPNPIGIVGGQYQYQDFIGFCEHQSSIPYWEQGYGFNSCGIKYLVNQ